MLIFGATGSVGSALAAELRDKGFDVCVAGRDPDRIRSLAEKVDGFPVVCPEVRPESIAHAFAEVAASGRSLVGVANCIGSVLLKPAHLTTDDDWLETLEVNLGSSFAIVRESAKALREQGGSVALVSSAAAHIGIPNHEAIAAAKAGIIGLTRSAAATYAPRGIRFNAVAPGLVKSNMTRRIWESAAAAANSQEMHALGRLGEPEDIAAALTFLLDPKQSWITGQVLGVDGGLGTLLPKRKA